MRAAPLFPFGYHAFHPDVSINYQLNRFSDGSPESVTELTAAAARITGYAAYTRELLALAAAADVAGRVLAGALYLRSAEFYMLPEDARKAPARARFVSSMRSVFGVDDTARDAIPYGGCHLHAYRITPPEPLGTMVLFGGFDSYMEELLATQRYFVGRGYDVILFEGPGQGGVLEEDHLPLTPHWGRVVSAVIDHYDLSDVTLLGYSLGGCLAIRAAAGEPRVRRVVCDDVLTDFSEVTLSQVPAATRVALKALLAVRAGGAVNRLAARAMRGSPVADWGLRHGMHTTGTITPFGFLRDTARYETASVSGRVSQDFLLLAGSHDHYVPRAQLARQLDSLTAARSVTARLLTADEQAHNHVHVGNVELSLQVIATWLTSLDERDRMPEAR